MLAKKDTNVHEKGFVLWIALLLSVIFFSFISILVVETSLSYIKIQKEKIDLDLSNALDAGIEKALFKLQKNRYTPSFTTTIGEIYTEVKIKVLDVSIREVIVTVKRKNHTRKAKFTVYVPHEGLPFILGRKNFKHKQFQQP